MLVGVLAVQGGFSAHLAALGRLGVAAVPVRHPEQIPGLDAMVLPGGESSTQLRLIERSGLAEPLRAHVAGGRRLLATCAGLILSARSVADPAQACFGFLDVAVRRNGWGRQVHSFEATADDGAIQCIFIRAPRIADAGRTEVLATLGGEPILVRQGRVMGATFHPELTDDGAVFERWLG